MELVWKYGRLSSIPFLKSSIPFWHLPYSILKFPFHSIPCPAHGSNITRQCTCVPSNFIANRRVPKFSLYNCAQNSKKTFMCPEFHSNPVFEYTKCHISTNLSNFLKLCLLYCQKLFALAPTNRRFAEKNRLSENTAVYLFVYLKPSNIPMEMRSFYIFANSLPYMFLFCGNHYLASLNHSNCNLQFPYYQRKNRFFASAAAS